MEFWKYDASVREARRILSDPAKDSGMGSGYMYVSVDIQLLKETARRVYQSNGYSVEAEYDPGGVQVVSADCPSQICVYTGRISHSGQVTVCLPSRIVILLEGTADAGVPDAVLR